MKATRNAYGESLVEYGSDQRIIVLDCDLSKSTKTYLFYEKYKERFFNIGVAEANMMGIATGLSLSGKIVFASSFAIFASGRAFEQIRNSICITKSNVKIVATHSGVTVGEDGASHQAIEDIALMRVIPNMTIVCPSDYNETKKAIKAAIDTPGPFYVRLSRISSSEIFDESYDFKLGKGVTLKDGNDITIIYSGILAKNVLEAAENLEKLNIKTRVINIHTIKPIDEEIILKAAFETKMIVTVEEHSIIGGLGSCVSEVVCEKYPTKVKKIGINDCFGKSGTSNELISYFKLDSNSLTKKIEEFFNTSLKDNI